MATRLYLDKSVHALAPGATRHSSWTDGAGFGPSYPSAQPRTLTTTKADSAGDTAITTGSFYGGTEQNALLTQLISDPLPAQVLEGSITAAFAKVYSSPSGGYLGSWMVVRVMSGDLTTVRRVLVAIEDTTSRWWPGRDPDHPSAGAVAFATTEAFSSCTIEDGDRIVVELGAYAPSDSSYPTPTIYVGAHSAESDYTTLYDTANKNGYVEFSAELWPTTVALQATCSVASGGTGEIDVTAEEEPTTSDSLIVARAAMGGDLDVYEPVPVAATVSATTALGGDLYETVFLGED